MSSRFRLRFLYYVGGKTYLVKQLRGLIPPHRCYVEVFGGGGQLLFAKKPSKVEVYNDIDGRLVNLMMVARDQGQEFQHRLETLPYSRRVYNKFRDEPSTGDPVEDAVRFYYVTVCSFNGEYGSGWSYSVWKNHASRWAGLVSQLRLISARLQNVQIEETDFRTCIETYDRSWTLFYCDPPYYGVKRYKYTFKEKDHEDLAKLLSNVKGKWLVTYNDHPRIRHLYAGYNLKVVRKPVQTSLVKAGRSRGLWDQLIIANYDLPEEMSHKAHTLWARRVRIPGVGIPTRSERPKIRSS